MKAAAIIVSILFFVLFTSETGASIRNEVRTSATGENSNVDIKINNSNSGTTTYTSSVNRETTTQVDIDQEGEGTSTVTINGKEYKVDGPGSLHVNENITPNTTGSETITPINPGSPTVTPTPNSEVLGVAETKKSFLENLFSQLRETFRNFFSNLF